MGLLHDTTLCVGCRSCEAACKEVNELPPLERPIGDMSVFDRERRTTDTELTVVNRYRVDGKDVFRKLQCMHCNEPSCASVCLVRALVKSPEGTGSLRPGCLRRMSLLHDDLSVLCLGV